MRCFCFYGFNIQEGNCYSFSETVILCVGAKTLTSLMFLSSRRVNSNCFWCILLLEDIY